MHPLRGPRLRLGANLRPGPRARPLGAALTLALGLLGCGQATGCGGAPSTAGAVLASAPIAAAAAIVPAVAKPEVPPTPPPGLACLTRWYPITVARADGLWNLVLPDGTAYLYDDGKTKTLEEAAEAMDFEDTYRPPYRRGPITPVVDELDPGEFRHEPLFHATYGGTEKDVSNRLVRIDFLGTRLRVNKAAAPAFQKVAVRLAALMKTEPKLKPFLEELGGTYNWRPIAGTEMLSAHSYGIAIDINVKRSAYWRWQQPAEPLKWKNQVPQQIVDAFEAEGFIWGGRWYHYDTMHFEFRPELVDPACAGPTVTAAPGPR